MSDDRKEILAKLHQLPYLPLIIQEVIASFNDADLDTSLLAHKIEQDQGLSAKVLRVANSAFYGLSRKVGSIQDAIVVLGFDTVRSLVLTTGMVKAFPQSPGSLFDRQAYWQRSFRVAVISQVLAKNLSLGNQLAFTSGMFYDIGQLVLDLCATDRFAGLLREQSESGLSLIEIERTELGFDHADLGAEVMRLWNFPPEIEHVVRYVYQPELQTTFEPLVCVVHMAVLLEKGVRGEELIAKLSEKGCGRIQVTWEAIEAGLPSQVQLAAATSLFQDS